MKAPEKLYIDVSDKLSDSIFYGFTERKDGDIEYISKDAFIEKTCEWLKNNVEKYYYLDEAYDKVISTKNLNNDFKKYMEG